MKESWIKSEDDFVINMDKWKPGVPLFVTGTSGDGKTTLAMKLAKENNAIILHGDVLLARLRCKNEDEWINKNKSDSNYMIDDRGLFIFEEYINTHKLPYGLKLGDIENISKYFNDFIYWLIKTLPVNNRMNKNKYILETCNICSADPKIMSKYPLIIIGVSRLTALLRRSKRYVNTHDKTNMVYALFRQIKNYNKVAKGLDDNKEFFKTMVSLYNESGTSSDVDRIINTFTKNELKEFAPNGNPENHSNNVIYRDVKKVNGVPVAFIEVDQYGDDKKNNECNISVGCDPKYRGNGYTKELLSKFIKTQGHKYNKIWYGYKKTNTGSKKLIESIGGFKNVGGTEGMEWNTLEIKESALSTDKRNSISSKDFGLPDQRKYPMHDKEHVLLAIKFFNYCPAKDKDELAKNIIEKIDYYFDEGEKMNIKIGDKNSFKKYWDNSINESCKDVTTARKFVSEVDKLAKKYNANYFIVTDGASGISNNGNLAVTNARKSQIEWEKKNGFDPNEDWSNNINEGYFSDLDIELEEYGEPILDDYKYTNKPTQDGFIDKRGTWGSILKYKNNYFRERVEALIIDGNKIFLAFIPDGVNNNFYKIPGGSSEKDDSLTNQLQNECNEEAKIKIKNPKYILSYMIKYQNGDYIDPKHKYYGAITHLYIAEYNGRYTGIVDEVDLAPKILKYGRFYKINEIFEKLRPVHKVALLSKDNKYELKTENVVENTYFKLDYDNMEAFYEEVLHKQDLYPVFICSFEYDSSYKKIIKVFTASRFTHSGVSFNSKLSEIFSFAKQTVSGDHVGGFYIEDIKDVKINNYNNYIKIDVVFVNKDQYYKMQNFIRKLYNDINNTNYNTGNILNIAFKKPTIIDDMNMVCSTFVAYIFEIVGIKLVNKDTTLVTPADIARSKEKYIHTLFNDKGSKLDLKEINKNLISVYNTLYNNQYNLDTSYLTNKGFYK